MGYERAELSRRVSELGFKHKMELFLPNNLSRTKPEFTPVHDVNLYREVSESLASHYGLPNVSRLRLSSFVGANVVSKNFLVEVESDCYFLKLRPVEDQPGLEKEAQLAARLAEMGSKVPRVVYAKDGALVSKWGRSCGALYVFEEGNYFSGNGNELRSAAESFGELTAAAARIQGQPSEHAKPAFLDELASLLRDGFDTDPAVANLCREHCGQVLEQLNEVGANRDRIESKLLPMHLDYHPLNLLMRDGEVVCILDFEHLRVYPVLAGVGFAAYKLVRQAMVNEAIRAAEFTSPSLLNRWLAGWAKSFPDLEFSPAELGLGARYRVLSLIHFILDAWLKRGDDRFNYDLEKQFGSLYEIDAIVAGY